MNSFLQRHGGLIAINLICLASLLPFLAKPYHLDDPMYLWAAEQIAQHPLDPYGFDVNWYGRTQPMPRVMKNPPLMSYYMAAWSVVGGWGEVVMHGAALLPALALATATYLLARRLCPAHAFAAAAATVLAPATLVSSTTVMCDVVMMSLYVWSVYLWVRGIDERRMSLLVAAGVLAGLSPLGKYFGVSLIPLLGAYALLRTRRLGSWAIVLLIPVAILTAYQQWTASLYGRGLLLDAAGYAAEVRWGGGAGWVVKVLTSLAFLGGCAATAVGIAVAVARRRAIVTLTLAAAIVFAAMLFFEPFQAKTGPQALVISPWLMTQMALFAAGGVVLLWQAARAWWRQRSDAGATLLVLWVAGTLVFATVVNWSTNARAMLPLVPAVVMLLLRRPVTPVASTPEDAEDAEDDDLLAAPATWSLVLGVAVGGMLAVAAAVADYSLAQSARHAADAFAARAASNDPSKRWFLGHWGFQWYMEQRGFTAVDASGSVLVPHEHIAVPLNNSNVHRLPETSYRTVERLSFPTVPFATTMSKTTGAGFYSDVWGSLPFAFGPAPAEEYRDDEVMQRMVLRTQ